MRQNPQLEAALDFGREGDVLVVTKLDRLARSVSDLMTIIQSLERKAVGLRILNLGMDTQTPTGKLMLTVLGGIAQFEREMMLERQREGVAKAKVAGKYKGRKPLAIDLRQEVFACFWRHGKSRHSPKTQYRGSHRISNTGGKTRQTYLNCRNEL